MSDLNQTHFSPDVEQAIAAFAAEHIIDRDEAVRRITRDWLIYAGYLPAPEEADVMSPSGGAVVVGGGG